jgi:hypothetical protein
MDLTLTKDELIHMRSLDATRVVAAKVFSKAEGSLRSRILRKAIPTFSESDADSAPR